MKKTKIEWTEVTWNPTTGCDKISEGCTNCYAEVMAKRLHAMGQKKYVNNFKLTLHPETLSYPCTLTKPHIIFVNSMSDLFHKNIPEEYIKKVFSVMNNTNHIYQILTKRAERLEELAPQLTWSNNIWMGVTVENNKYLTRVACLENTPAQVKFISAEPLIGSLLNISLEKIDWLVVGGESGFRSREIKKEWVIELKYKCLNSNTAFFFKQWGGVNKKKNGRILDGQIWSQMPKDIGFNNAKKKQVQLELAY